MEPVRILIAEDHEVMRRGLRSLLASRSGWELCGEAADGREAVEKAKQLQPDVIVLDISMPLLNGLDATRMIRKEVPHAEILILSQHSASEMKPRALEAGARAYVSKSEVARELLAALEAVIQYRRPGGTPEARSSKPPGIRESTDFIQAPHDITRGAADRERQLHPEAELERSHLRELFIQTPIPIAISSGPRHRVAFVNDAFVKGTGRSCAADLVGKTAREAFPEVEGQGFFELLDEVYRTGTAYSGTETKIVLNRGPSKEPTEAYFNFIYQPIRDRAGAVEGILVHAVEVTEQVLARDQLEARVQERGAELERAEDSLRALSGRLLQAQDEERRRIARDLHDSTGQALAALNINLSIVQPEAPKLSPDASKALIQSLDVVREMSKELRTISYLLHPPLLDEAGLPSAIRWYVEGFAERSKIQVDLELSPDLGRLSREQETAIFRIVQECLNNIHRHAESPTATIRLARDSHQVRLEVRDQGKGMPVAHAAAPRPVRPGVGIEGMRERVRQLGGRLEIRSSASGTSVTAVLPVATAAAQSAS